MDAILLPPGLAAGTTLLLVVASFFTSAATAAFGIGGGLSLLAIMSTVLPVAVLIPVHGLVQLASNLGRVLVQRRAVSWRALLPFLAGAALGALIGARFVVTLPEAVLQTTLGAFILILALAKLPAIGRIGAPGFAFAGLVTTFLSMFVGATAPINAAFFAKAFDDRTELVATLAATTFLQHLFKSLAFFALGVGLAAYAPLIAAMIVTGFAGTLAGTALLKRIDERLFRFVLTAILVVISLDLLRRGLTGLL